MPPPLTRHISQIIVDVISLIVSICVLNQSKGHWLQLNDALNFNISICLKLKEETNLVSFDNFMERGFIITLELVFLNSNIKKKLVVF